MTLFESTPVLVLIYMFHSSSLIFVASLERERERAYYMELVTYEKLGVGIGFEK